MDEEDLSRLAREVGELLWRRGETVALAESCTGGLIAAALTTIPGSSDYVWGGAVVYSFASKVKLVGLDTPFLRDNGTVSETTTQALAFGMRDRSGATYGLAVTGWAGPDAESPEELGTVYVAYSKDPEILESRRYRFEGGRQEIRVAAAKAALEWLRDVLRETDEEGPSRHPKMQRAPGSGH